MPALHNASYLPATIDESKNSIALLMIHGGALSGRMYDDTIQKLKDLGYRLIVPDLPGHGRSVQLGPFTFGKSTYHLQEVVHDLKSNNAALKIVAVGISLGGQAVLDLISNSPSLVNAAIVSGVAIHPPDDRAQWEMPRMPTSEAWMNTIMEDVQIVGTENAQFIQNESFRFTLKPLQNTPPVLVVIGESDIAMAKRDFQEVVALAQEGNSQSRGMVLEDAWHNHSIDLPDSFVNLIEDAVTQFKLI